MLFCLEYMRVFYQKSTDDGVTWSSPTEITSAFDAFKDNYDWKVLATGPNHSIQLRTGRLIVPVWLSTGTGGNAHRPSVTATVYSDDAGSTWHAGDIAVPCPDEWINPNETIAIALNDGKTWTVTKTIESGPSMYSDIAVTPKGTILCFYGRGTTPGFAGSGLTLARFNLEWLNAPEVPRASADQPYHIHGQVIDTNGKGIATAPEPR